MKHETAGTTGTAGISIQADIHLVDATPAPRYGVAPCLCGVTLDQLQQRKEKRNFRAKLYGRITCPDCLEKESK